MPGDGKVYYPGFGEVEGGEEMIGYSFSLNWIWWFVIAFFGLLAIDILLVILLYWANIARGYMPGTEDLE